MVTVPLWAVCVFWYLVGLASAFGAVLAIAYRQSGGASKGKGGS